MISIFSLFFLGGVFTRLFLDDFAFVAVATAPSFFQSFEQLLGLDHLEREMIFSSSFIYKSMFGETTNFYVMI